MQNSDSYETNRALENHCYTILSSIQFYLKKNKSATLRMTFISNKNSISLRPSERIRTNRTNQLNYFYWDDFVFVLFFI